jgi:uncharacterized membrane protein YfcA
MEIFGLIFILAIVQSLFGVGILLFGTPLLLLMGLSYEEALLYLLPSSLILSLSQVWDYREHKLEWGYRNRFIFYCLPALILGLFFGLKLNLKFEIKLVISIMLLLTFFIRSSVRLRTKLQSLMKQNLPITLTLMGLIHGLSNMGGSILAPLASSLYQDKKRVLAAISFDYAFMAALQLLFLITFFEAQLQWRHLLSAALAILVRILIGQKIFIKTSEANYQRMMNVFILSNAIILGLSLT